MADSGTETTLGRPEPEQLALLPDEPQPDDHDEQLEALPEWDGTIPVPYGVIPF